MPRKMATPVPDPTVTVVVWHGKLTDLAARMGMMPAELTPALHRVGRRIKGHLQVELQSPVAMTTFRRLLERRPDDPV